MSIKKPRMPNKFTGYTLEDCACEFCLHYAGARKPCPLETCCCEDERAEALAKVPFTAPAQKNPALSFV